MSPTASHRLGHGPTQLVGVLQRPEMPEPGEHLHPRRGQPLGHQGQNVGTDGIGLPAAGECHRTPDLAQVGESVVGQAVGVHLGLVLPPAPEPDPVALVAETVVDVRLQGLGVEAIERRLGGEVGQRLGARGEHLPPV